MSKTASQKLLRDLNQRIGQLEQQLAECKQVSNAHCLQADNYRVQLAQLRRGLDNIKVRSYELGQRELHDMALAELKKQ